MPLALRTPGLSYTCRTVTRVVARMTQQHAGQRTTLATLVCCHHQVTLCTPHDLQASCGEPVPHPLRLSGDDSSTAAAGDAGWPFEARKGRWVMWLGLHFWVRLHFVTGLGLRLGSHGFFPGKGLG